jgi:hypothetical protein
VQAAIVLIPNSAWHAGESTNTPCALTCWLLSPAICQKLTSACAAKAEQVVIEVPPACGCFHQEVGKVRNTLGCGSKACFDPLQLRAHTSLRRHTGHNSPSSICWQKTCGSTRFTQLLACLLAANAAQAAVFGPLNAQHTAVFGTLCAQHSKHALVHHEPY